MHELLTGGHRMHDELLHGRYMIRTHIAPSLRRLTISISTIVLHGNVSLLAGSASDVGGLGSSRVVEPPAVL